MAIDPVKWPARADWRKVLVRTWKEAGDDNVSLLAAGVAFYAFLAFVPLLAAAVLSYGLIAAPETVAGHIESLARSLPREAAAIVADQLRGMTEGDDRAKGFSLLLALGLAFYGASKGAGAAITALNVAYEVPEARGFIGRTLVSLAMTLGAVVTLLLGALAISAFGFIEHLLPFGSPLVHGAMKTVFWLVAAVVVSLVIAMVYRYGPNRPAAPWQWVSPGSAAATLLWLAASFGFGLYVSNFGNYNATYGSLGGVVVFLTWLYLTAYILLMGGELNSELERQQKCRDEQEAPVPAAPAPPPAASVAAATGSAAQSLPAPRDRRRGTGGRALLAGGIIAAGAALLRRIGRRERRARFYRGQSELAGQTISARD